MVGIAEVAEAGVELRDDTTGEGAEASGGRPEREGGVGFCEEFCDGEGIVDGYGERGDGEGWDPAGGGRFDLGFVRGCLRWKGMAYGF